METPISDKKVVIVCSTDEGRKYSISAKHATISKYLETLITSDVWKNTKNEQGELRVDIDPEEFDTVMHYIETGYVLEPIKYSTLDFLLLKLLPHPDVKEDYLQIQLEENWCRLFTQDNPRCPHLKLKDMIHKITQFAPLYRENMIIFSTVKSLVVNEHLRKNFETYDQVKFKVGRVLDLSHFKGKLVLAGGALVATTFVLPVNDYDLFFVGCNQDEAEDIMCSAIDLILKEVCSGQFIVKLSASKTSWTLEINKTKFQFIFRLYANIEEILLGFDVDSCAIAYDGNDIVLSKRCAHAFETHTNIVDFNRMSPTYEYRLYKYTLRGFDVFIPSLDVKKVIRQPGQPVLSSNSEVRINPLTGDMLLFSRKREGSMMSRHLRRYMTRKIRRNYNNNYPLPASNPQSNNNASKKMEEDDEDGNAVLPGPGELFHDSKGKLRTEPDLKLHGFSVLMYLCHTRVPFHLKISDYTIFFNPSGGEKIINFENATHGLHGKFVQVIFICNSGRQYGRFLIDLVQSKEVDIHWMKQNPGQQITSSFHAKVAQFPSLWLHGEYYAGDFAAKEEIVDRTTVKYMKI